MKNQKNRKSQKLKTLVFVTFRNIGFSYTPDLNTHTRFVFLTKKSKIEL